MEILDLKEHKYCFIDSKVKWILQNEWILPSGEVASGRVCACSLRSRLVSIVYSILCIAHSTLCTAHSVLCKWHYV